MRKENNFREEQQSDEEVEEHEAPQESHVSHFQKLASGIKEFVATQFKGEVREEEEDEKIAEEFIPTEIRIVKAAMPAMVGAMVSILGVKSLADVPRYVLQKIFTQREKTALKQAFEAAEDQKGEQSPDLKTTDRGAEDKKSTASPEVNSHAAELRTRIKVHDQ